jgi:hypothetical protein
MSCSIPDGKEYPTLTRGRDKAKAKRQSEKKLKKIFLKVCLVSQLMEMLVWKGGKISE